MDLEYGPRYEAFRAEVRAFLERHGDKAPKRAGLRDPATLVELTAHDPARPGRLFGAIRVGGTRLIDSVAIAG